MRGPSRHAGRVLPWTCRIRFVPQPTPQGAELQVCELPHALRGSEAQQALHVSDVGPHRVGGPGPLAVEVTPEVLDRPGERYGERILLHPSTVPAEGRTAGIATFRAEPAKVRLV